MRQKKQSKKLSNKTDRMSSKKISKTPSKKNDGVCSKKNDKHKSDNPTFEPIRLDAAALARTLSDASGKPISEEELQRLAKAGGLLDADGRIDLVDFAAYLIKEKNGNH